MSDMHTRNGPVAVRFDSVSFSYEHSCIVHVSFYIHQMTRRLVGRMAQQDNGPQPPRSGKTGVGPHQSVRELTGRHGTDRLCTNAGYDSGFPVTVRSVVRMGRLRPSSRFFGKEDARAVQEAMEKADIAGLADRSYSALSGGQRRRVLVARALASRPSLLVLDEPTANMDVESEKRLFDTLGTLKGSTTILIVTHDSAFVSSLTDVAFCVAGGVRGCSVVRHRTEPAADAPHDLYGGSAARVRHDIEVPDVCCGEAENS